MTGSVSRKRLFFFHNRPLSYEHHNAGHLEFKFTLNESKSLIQSWVMETDAHPVRRLRCHLPMNRWEMFHVEKIVMENNDVNQFSRTPVCFFVWQDGDFTPIAPSYALHRRNPRLGSKHRGDEVLPNCGIYLTSHDEDSLTVPDPTGRTTPGSPGLDVPIAGKSPLTQDPEGVRLWWMRDEQLRL